jgi:leader peptidase (prepilin peptidase)/N-methyltransferase
MREDNMLIFSIAFIINFLVWGTYITIRDVKEHLIPNKYIGFFILSSIGVALIPHHFHSAGHYLSYGFISGLFFFITFLIMRVISRGRIGMGDVKLAFPMGINIGIIQPDGFEAALLFIFLAAGVAALVRKGRGQSLSEAIPFAPFMFIGSAISIGLMFASKS